MLEPSRGDWWRSRGRNEDVNELRVRAVVIKELVEAQSAKVWLPCLSQYGARLVKGFLPVSAGGWL